MNAVLKGSVVLAILVALLSIAVAVTGLHENVPVGGLLSIAVAIAINVAVVWWVLKQTAVTNGYLMQLMNAVLVGLIGGALILALSLLILSVLFPTYLEEAIAAQIAFYESTGLSEEQLAEQIERAEATTPMRQAFAGFVGTFFTSLVVGAIAAIFVRRK